MNLSKRKVIFFSGTDNQINVDDGILITYKDHKFFVLAKKVEIDAERDFTKVEFELKKTRVQVEEDVDIRNDEDEINTLFENQPTSDGEFNVITENELNTRINNLTEYIKLNNGKIHDIKTRKININHKELRIYIFRKKGRIFGHNAPLYKMIENNFPIVAIDMDGNVERTYKNWDEGDYRHILADGKSVGQLELAPDDYLATIFLDQNYSGISRKSLVVLYTANESLYGVYSVKSVSEETFSDYTLTGVITKMKIVPAIVFEPGHKLHSIYYNFYKRFTSVYHMNEELLLSSELPIDTINESLNGNENINEIILDKMIVGLISGQEIILSGEIIQHHNDIKLNSGIIRHEKIRIHKIEHIEIDHRDILFTHIIFENFLKFEYKLDTVTINANISSATHGETTNELIGFGDVSKQILKYKLNKSPLTYVTAPTPSGIKSTLQNQGK